MEKLIFIIQNSPFSSFVMIITIVTSFYAFTDNDNLFNKFRFNPYLVSVKKEYYRLLTSALIHVNYVHLFVNMISFYFSAFEIENRFTSSFNLALIYILSIIGGGIPDLIKQKDNYHYNAVGASGGISGVLFAMSLYAIAFAPGSMVYLFFIIPVPIWLFPFVFIAYSILIEARTTQIAYLAHLGGALTGTIVTLLLDRSLIFYVVESLKFKFGNLF